MGDKFNVLDKDGDGHLTAHELREAIVQLLRREFSLQEADQLVDMLDDDKDGKVSLSELLHYIEKRKESLELEALHVSFYVLMRNE
ncbi:EF-hand domain-containing protein [archaeon]|nr:MAG: EF-hand domain-containing protein [archaeon]